MVRGNSAAAIQFSFSNQANFHSRFICCQCVFDPVPLSTLSLFSCVFEFSSKLICWRPKEIYHHAKNQCHCCGINHFQRPDLRNAGKRPRKSTVDEISMLKRKIEPSETSIVKLQAHTERGTCARDLRFVAKANITPDEEFKTEINSI